VLDWESHFYIRGDRDERGGYSRVVESGTAGTVNRRVAAVAVETTGGVEGVVREGESSGGVSGERSFAIAGGE